MFKVVKWRADHRKLRHLPSPRWRGPGRGWQLGEPDYIVHAPRQDIPPTGVLDYTYEQAEPGFSEEKWVRALQYLPGDESVLHHLNGELTFGIESWEEMFTGYFTYHHAD